MPKTLDILIGITLVMLLFSMAVTVISQFVLSTFNTRGKHLRNGIGDILQTFGIAEADSIKIAKAVLLHPLIASTILGKDRMGDVIHREELITILFELADGQTPIADDPQGALKKKLTDVLTQQGITDPKTILDQIRMTALHLEQAEPELACHLRQSMAVMKAAESKFVARVHAKFDATMDRVSARFTGHARLVTLVGSVIIAVAFQLDTISMFNRLSVDEQLRSAMTGKANELAKVSSTQTQNGTQSQVQLPRVDPKDFYNFFSSTGLIVQPISPGAPREVWNSWKESWGTHKVPGILISVLLLSLGAPFWYEALKNLLKLRSVISGKDDAQRQERQTTQAPTADKPESAAAAAAAP